MKGRSLKVSKLLPLIGCTLFSTGIHALPQLDSIGRIIADNNGKKINYSFDANFLRHAK